MTHLLVLLPGLEIVIGSLLFTCKRLGCVHHRSLPTRKSKKLNIGRITYISEKLGRDSRCLNPDFLILRVEMRFIVSCCGVSLSVVFEKE